MAKYHEQVMTGEELAGQLMQHCNYFTGVPDGVLKTILPHVAPYYPAPREDHAMAMAFGARMMGKKPCVIMQNSGVGYIGDVLLGLFKMYNLGTVMVVGNRGEFDFEEPQHRAWHFKTRHVLQQYEAFAHDLITGEDEVAYAAHAAWELNKPAAVLIRRGIINEN